MKPKLRLYIECFYNMLILLPILLIALVVNAFSADPVPILSDAQIVGISMTTNSAQIQGSQYSYPRIQYFDLKNFANAMVADYQNYQNIILDFSRKSGVNPAPSQQQSDIESRGKQVLSELEQLTGMALEKRYVDAEIELHQQTLSMMEQNFLPNVQNQELKNLIMALRGTIQARLEWAMKIQAQYPKTQIRTDHSGRVPSLNKSEFAPKRPDIGL